MQSKIIYEDKDIIIIHKPAGLATQTAAIGRQDVESELKNYLGKGSNTYLGVIHRLDQPVEGLLVFAKNKPAAASLTKQLTGGTLNKHYYALVCGKPERETGELVDYLYKTKDNKARVVSEREASQYGAKKAVLQYHLTKYKKAEDVWLAKIHIDTGRFHQIRCQMAHGGLPLLGDGKYGSEDTKAISQKLGIRNVALCACELTLRHPVTGQEMCFTIEPQEFMKQSKIL